MHSSAGRDCWAHFARKVGCGVHGHNCTTKSRTARVAVGEPRCAVGWTRMVGGVHGLSGEPASHGSQGTRSHGRNEQITSGANGRNHPGPEAPLVGGTRQLSGHISFL